MNHYVEHFGAVLTACGIDRRTGGTLGFTNQRFAVTCPECKTTDAFKRSVQRIPNVPVPVGLKHVS